MTQPRKRRRVFVTAGLSASAAVLAMAVQAGLDQVPDGSSYGDTTAAIEPDGPDAAVEPEGE